MVKYLQLVGYRVAYVERNQNEYSKGVLALYRGAKRYKSGVFYQDVILYGKDSIKEMEEEKYDFLVKDYGSVRDAGFEKVSFLEQKRHLLVCGVKADEILYTEEALEQYGEDCDAFCFSFVAIKDRKEIELMMGAKKSCTHFAEWISDPFCFHPSSAACCQTLLFSKRK